MKNAIICLLIILFFTYCSKNGDDLSREEIIGLTTDEINEDSVSYFIQSMQDFGTRYMLASNRKEIAKWISSKFTSFGIEDVRIDSFISHTIIPETRFGFLIDTITWQYNVIATLAGTTDEKIILCAHYDSFTGPSADNKYPVAPGADDDASGTAACLEVARVLSGLKYPLNTTVEICAFAAEELMNFGKGGYDYHSDKAKSEGDNITLVIHNDMIGNNGGAGSISFSNYTGCEEETNLLANMCNKYTSLMYILWPATMGPFADRAFYHNGYKCVYVEETTFSPNYHSATDIIDNIDISFCTEVIRISCAAILTRAL